MVRVMGTLLTLFAAGFVAALIAAYWDQID